jgi:AcrR family transcriptional regulator
MARVNNPKQTVEKIITVAGQLFAQKGYEQTTMQDIVDGLGMSKGVIFYHFNSKADIFEAVLRQQSENTAQTIRDWLAKKGGLSAKEKLTGLLDLNAQDKLAHSLDSVIASQIQSPHLVMASMRACVNDSAPIFAQIMREGKEDGSITTEFPDECAEVFFLLLNLWCDPVLFACEPLRYRQRLLFLRQLMMEMGADIISDEYAKNHISFMERLYKIKEENHGNNGSGA